MKKLKRILLKVIIVATALYLVLLIPDGKSTEVKQQTGKKTFFWNRDDEWQLMEENFQHAKQMPPAILDSSIQILKNIAENKLAVIEKENFAAGDID